MRQRPTLALLGLAAALGLLGLLAWHHGAPGSPGASSLAPPPAPRFVGAEACAGCHAAEASAWRGSQHARSMQHATDATVLGDFDDARFEQRGTSARFLRQGRDFMVRTAGADGKVADFKVSHTFGVFPLQQYLVAFPDGRLQALPFAWDSRSASEGGGRWFHPDIAGLGLSWTRDTRDDVFTPSRGQSLSLGLTVHAPALGASFEQQSLKLDWAGYRAGPGKATLGLRTIAEASAGDAPFYLRPYVALRGVAKLRYAGERAASAELELRHPAGKRWDVLGFAGAGRACSTRDGNRGCKSVTAGGVGVRFKAMKLFGLTFGVDVARGPDGTAGYIQIGNAWSR